jgi:hypothetical protein
VPGCVLRIFPIGAPGSLSPLLFHYPPFPTEPPNELSRRLDVRYVVTRALDVAVRLSGADAAVMAMTEGNAIRNDFRRAA